MDRQDFMDIVYAELADDPDNNRANRITDAADEYVEYSLAKQSAQPEIIDGRLFVTVDDIKKVNCVLVDEHKSKFCRQFWMDGDGFAPCEDAVSREAVKEQMLKYGFLAPDMTVTEFVEDCLPPVTPKQRWIPVTERLPKDFVMVLMSVYRSDKTYNQYPYLRIGYYHNNDWFPIPQRTLTSPPFDKTLSQYDGGDPVVTAWAYLPKPWEGDAE